MIIGNKMTSGHGERKKKQGTWDGHQSGSPEPQEVAHLLLPPSLPGWTGGSHLALLRLQFKFPDLHSKGCSF